MYRYAAYLFTLILSCLLSCTRTEKPCPETRQEINADDYAVKYKGFPLSDKFTVMSGDQAIKTCRTGENGYSFAALPENSLATGVKIAYTLPIQQIRIYPEEAGWAEHQTGSKEFILHKKADIACCTIIINNDRRESIHLLSGTTETADRENTICFKKNFSYETGELAIPSNSTVIIQEGAILRGRLQLKNVSDVDIYGEGFMDCSANPEKAFGIDIENSRNISLSGVSFITGASQAIRVKKSQDITIKDVKVLGSEDALSGISLASSRNVSISNNFIRSKGAGLLLSSGHPEVFYPTAYDLQENLSGVDISSSIFWHSGHMAPLTIGYKTWCEKIRGIDFHDSDIIMQEGTGAVFGIYCTDKATIEDIRIERIRASNCSFHNGARLIDMGIFIGTNSYDAKEKTLPKPEGIWDKMLSPGKGSEEWHSAYRGQIRNISFSGLQLDCQQVPYSLLQGWDAQHRIGGIRMEGITLADGTAVTSEEMMNIRRNCYTSSIEFEIK